MRKNQPETLTRSAIFFRPGVRRKATGGQTPTSGQPPPAGRPGLPPLRSPTARRKSVTRRVSPSPVPRPRNGSARRRVDPERLRVGIPFRVHHPLLVLG